MKIYIVMSDGVATSLERLSFTDSARNLNWGVAAYEQTGVLARRGMFIHDFTPEELDQPPMSTNPNVEVLDAVPEDWRYEIPV